MEFVVTLMAIAIGVAILRIDRTLMQVNRNLEQIASAIRDKT